MRCDATGRAGGFRVFLGLPLAKMVDLSVRFLGSGGQCLSISLEEANLPLRPVAGNLLRLLRRLSKVQEEQQLDPVSIDFFRKWNYTTAQIGLDAFRVPTHQIWG